MTVAEVIEPDGAAVIPYVPTPAASLTLFGSDDPTAVVDKASKVAKALMGVVQSAHLAVPINGRDHLRVEAWTLLGSMLGVFPVAVWTHPIKDGSGTIGWEARVEARTRDGATVGAAEAMCMRAETTWEQRDEYALRSMAQTRATSKALAMPLRFVAVLAGYQGTPAEEMPHNAQPSPTPGAVGPPSAAPLAPLGERPYVEGDPCPTCAELGISSKFAIAKGGKLKGSLQCRGKLHDGTYANHSAPLVAAEVIRDDTPIDF